MRRKGFLAALVVGVVALGVAAFALAGGSDAGFKRLSETLIGYQEVPAVSTTGSARFRAEVSRDGQSISWELSYRNLESPISQSHIHFGQRSVNGGISVFLCTNLGNGPAGMQPCPASPNTIRGTIRPSDVSPNIGATAGARAQGIDTGEWDELLRAIAAGKAYVNIHSAFWPGGEIRAQLNEHDEEDNDD
jgi:CHRD domain-containing protein